MDPETAPTLGFQLFTWVTFSVTFWGRSFVLQGLRSSILGVESEPLSADSPHFVRSESDMELCGLLQTVKNRQLFTFFLN